MKSQKFFFVLIVLLASFQICLGQKKGENLTLLDSVIEPNCEYLLNRLDFLLVETFKNSQSVGHVIIQGSSPIQNKFYERAVKNYSRFRNFDESRLAIISSKSASELRIDFVVSNNGKAKPDVIIQDSSYNLPLSDKPIMFARETVEIVEIDGESTFIGYSDVSCGIETVNLNLLSEFLKANPQLNANIKTYSKTRKRAKKLERMVRKEAINDYKIPITRLKFIYSGIDKSIVQLPGNISTIEIELVPAK
jgi:hypothetical protein